MPQNRIDQLCKIKSSFASQSKVQQKIARFVLANPDDLGRLTITQLASKLGIDPSSVTRFCQHQGFKGYSDFRFLMTHSLASSVPEEHDLIEAEDSVAQILEKSRRYSQKTIGEVFSLLEARTVERAAKSVYQAKNVHVYAQDGSVTSARYVQFMFLQIGIPACAFSERLLAVPAAETLSGEDVAIAISFSGDAKIVIDAVANAKKRKATIIGITGFANSTLAKQSDILLCYNSRVPDDLRYIHMIYTCELAIVSAIHSAILNKYHNELAPRLENANQAARVNRYK